MAASKDITAEYVGQLLDYNRKTGELRWKPRTPEMFVASGSWSAKAKCDRFNILHAGKVAGCLSKEGYLQIKFGGRQYRAHRLIRFLVLGVMPVDEVDHRNRKRADNSWDNLRDADRVGNRQNISKSSNNKSGYTGVHFAVATGRWRAVIGHNNRKIALGSFDHIQDAAEAYLAAKKKYHKFYQPEEK